MSITGRVTPSNTSNTSEEQKNMVPMGAIVAVVVIVDVVTVAVAVAPVSEEVLAAENVSGVAVVVVVLTARLEQKLSFAFNTWCLRSNSRFRWMQFVG